MLDALTQDSFSPHLGTVFEIRLEGRTVALELLEVKPYRVEGDTRRSRQPFSVFFRGPRDVYLPQQTVPLHHAAMGQLDIFLVPVGLEADGYRYEAVFT